MNTSEILLHAARLNSPEERAEFFARECREEQLQLIRQLSTSHATMWEDLAGLPDNERLQRIEQLLSSDGAAEPSDPLGETNIADSESLPGDEDLRRERTNTSATGVEGATIHDRYVLQNRIGSGGMGEVWAARQIAPVKRQVALKLIKRGMDSHAVLARFEQERQALAMMDHPNIAQVLDGGVTKDGQPFFVMELVHGLPLTEFADASKLNTTERLELFVSVCNAVQHAHQKGIVHRDLKPANILVTMVDNRPTPKVIDFGVAKATGGRLTENTVETEFGSVIGTLEYMSPEQAGFTGSDVDTRSDIYSLGVILYELLTSLRPIDRALLQQAGLTEMIRVIREDDPARPSTRLSTSDSLPSVAAVRSIEPAKLTALLKGELDWVVMKCLEKSRDRRYETAIGLAQDIQRFLTGEAVEARPASAGYRMSKFLRRHRGAVVASCLVLIALIAGVTGTTLGWLESRRQAEAARIETQTQAAVSSFLRNDILAQASAVTQSQSIFRPDPDLKVKTALDRAAQRIDERFADQPEVAAALHQTVGQAYSDLGEYAAGEPHLKSALRMYRKERGTQDLDALQTAQVLGYLYQEQNRLEDAERVLVESSQQIRALTGENSPASLRASLNVANLYAQQGRDMHDPSKRQLATKMYMEILESQRSAAGTSPLEISRTLFALALNYMAESRAAPESADSDELLNLAEESLEEALEGASDLPADHPLTLKIRYSLASLANKKLQFEKSFGLIEEVLAGCVRTYGEVHPTTARAMDSLALQYSTHNRIDEAEELYLKSLGIRRRLYGTDHPVTEHAIFSIAQFYLNLGNMPQAEVYYRERYDLQIQQDADSVDTHLAGRDLATICMSLGKLDEAEKLLADAVKGFEKHFDDDNPILVLTREYQADVYMNLGRFDDALSIYLKSVKMLRTMKKPQLIRLASALASLGECQLRMKRFVDAEASFRESTELFTQYLPDAWPAFAYKSKMGAAMAGQGKFSEAESILLAAFEEMSARRASIPPTVYQDAITAIMQLYEALEKPDEVKQWRDKLQSAMAQ